MADGGSRPGPSRRDKGKAKVGESIDLTSDDDQSERNEPRPGSGDSYPAPLGPEMRCCLSKTLTPREANPINPVLYLDAYETSTLIDFPDIIKSPSVSFSKNLDVFDIDNRSYKMLLSHCVLGEWTGYSLTRDWEKFVTVHNLEAGDTIHFHRSLERDIVSGDYYYYILTYVKKAELKVDKPIDAGQLESEVKVDEIPEENVSVPSKKSTYTVTYHIPPYPPKNIRPGPGSRRMPKEAMCFSMILTSLEVVEEHPKLHLSPDDAFLLTDCIEVLDEPPERFSEDLAVFDQFNSRYTMNISNHESGSPTSFILNTGWNRYVRTYNLKEGDELLFYRFLDSVSGDYYYVLRYIRKPQDKKRPSDDENTSGRKKKDAQGPGSRNLHP